MELRAQDLRIGNIFFIPGIERYVKVCSIFKTHFKCEDLNGVMFEESIRINYQPIPLTEEILLKCGFIKLDKEDYFYILQYDMNLKIGEDLKLIAWYDLALNNVKIKYLHQLQNLYFALTGSELNVKL